ncbi:MAG: hypothetical protein VYC40_00065 [Pseudomonadota bacterium]|nr:hypothetical protein [Pseudomonadota bacterium]
MQKQFSSLHYRLLEALSCYEWRTQQRSNVHPQRQNDIVYIRQCIHLISDSRLLEREITFYLDSLQTARRFFLFRRQRSVFRDMIMMVLREEKMQMSFGFSEMPDTPFLADGDSVSETRPLMLEE